MRAGSYDLTTKLMPFNFITVTTNNNNRLQRTQPFFLHPYRMATEGARATNTSASHPIQPKPEPSAAEKKHDSPPENSRKEIPPPPEKPEPGDCCGSGCVPCVWDTYYEQLEEYNKLYKQDTNHKS